MWLGPQFKTFESELYRAEPLEFFRSDSDWLGKREQSLRRPYSAVRRALAEALRHDHSRGIEDVVNSMARSSTPSVCMLMRKIS